MNCLQENSQNAPLVGSTLQTLLRFLNWIPLGYIFETKLVTTLIYKVCIIFFLSLQLSVHVLPISIFTDLIFEDIRWLLILLKICCFKFTVFKCSAFSECDDEMSNRDWWCTSGTI